MLAQSVEFSGGNVDLIIKNACVATVDLNNQFSLLQLMKSAFLEKLP